jgi:Reverse transcriptase (RNA-dependent DNA polymerase).
LAKVFSRCYNELLTKKNQAKKYSDHSTISPISNTGKIVARILSKRFESKLEEVIEEHQFGSRKGKDAIGLMRIILEKYIDVKEKMCLCFIDWQKAFDRVDWIKLLEVLRNIGVSWSKRRLIRNLYMGQRVKLHLNPGEADSIKIVRGAG